MTRYSIFSRPGGSLKRKETLSKRVAREQMLFLIHTGHYLRQCCAINTAVKPIKRRPRQRLLPLLLSPIFFACDMRTARSCASTHVPINEARPKEEPERISGLVFRCGQKKKKTTQKEERKARGARERRKSLKGTADVKSATRPRE